MLAFGALLAPTETSEACQASLLRGHVLEEELVAPQPGAVHLRILEATEDEEQQRAQQQQPHHHKAGGRQNQPSRSTISLSPSADSMLAFLDIKLQQHYIH